MFLIFKHTITIFLLANICDILCKTMIHLNHEFALKSWFSAITMFSELLHTTNSDIQITSRYQV